MLFLYGRPESKLAGPTQKNSQAGIECSKDCYTLTAKNCLR